MIVRVSAFGCTYSGICQIIFISVGQKIKNVEIFLARTLRQYRNVCAAFSKTIRIYFSW